MTGKSSSCYKLSTVFTTHSALSNLRDSRNYTCNALKVTSFNLPSLIECLFYGQLPPVADKPLYQSKPFNSLQDQGHLAHSVYFMLTTVVKQTVNQRVQGLALERAEFRDFLMWLCKGDNNENDWNLLLTHQPSMIKNVADVTLEMLQDYIIAMMKLQITTLRN